MQCLEGRGKQGGRVVLTRECDRKETGERNCQEWRREERVGNEGVLVDRSEAWHPESTCEATWEEGVPLWDVTNG